MVTPPITRVLTFLCCVSLCGCFPDELLDEPSKQNRDIQKGGAIEVPGNGDENGTGGTGGAGGHSGTSTEECDGWDNDLDGEVDEGTGGGQCSIEGSGLGTLECKDGKLECVQCEPGVSNFEDCGCGKQREDVCGEDGIWTVGACDGCEEPEVPCKECVPGEVRNRRCDSCPPGAPSGCGGVCVGAPWRCSEACEWEQIGLCEVLAPECDRDQLRVEPCARCGERQVSCDGCFWQFEPCENLGECDPGDRRVTPCFDNQCTDGWVGEIACASDCQWWPAACEGCTIGDSYETETPCVAGYDCGVRVTTTTCLADGGIHICGGGDTLTRGREVTETTTACSLECTPGQTEQCVTTGGLPGTRPIGCSDQCTLTGEVLPCGALPNACVPNEVISTTTEDCGCGATLIRTVICRPSGVGTTTQVDDSQCPECTPGQSGGSQPCTTNGVCGSRQNVCNATTCKWEPGECVPQNVCTPNDVESQTGLSCGANTCGKTYSRSRSCRSDGCGWSGWSEDRSQCPECSAGQSRSTSQQCVAGYPQCGTHQETCDNNCNWQLVPCPSCG